MDDRQRMHSETAFALSALIAVAVFAGCEDVGCPNGTTEVVERCIKIEDQLAAGADSPTAGAQPSAAPTQHEAGASASNVGDGMSGGGGSPGTAGVGIAQPVGGVAGAQSSGSGGATPPGQAGSAGGAANDSSSKGANPSGAAAGCVPRLEECDAQDNDCDGKIDEEVTRPCGPPEAIGICEPGTETCRAGAWGACEGAVEPQPEEICGSDKVDENCDGAKNEGCDCTDGEMQPCGKDKGVCKPGTQTCVEGKWSMQCQGAVDPKQPEACDEAKQDEDCDGTQNEGCDCIDGKEEACPGIAVGICKPGTRKCERGKWGTCTGVVSAETEACDNLDNDCNGTKDDSPRDCKSNERCVNGACKCEATCGSRECGMDECGRPCGTCPSSAKDGKCYTGQCSSSGICQTAGPPIRCAPDSDRDGWPDLKNVSELCSATCSGVYVNVANASGGETDCNDRDPEVFPKNTSFYHDAKDHNCDGKVVPEFFDTFAFGCETNSCDAMTPCVQRYKETTQADCGGMTQVCQNDACTNGGTCTVLSGLPIRCY
jgi:Putative metal-binding motif